MNQNLVRAFLNREIASLAFLARKRKVSEAFLQSELKKSRDAFNANTPWPAIPDGPLLFIADAVVEHVEGAWRTVYLMLARPVEGNRATILAPSIQLGTETVAGWRHAVDTLPPGVIARIQAIVSDGHNGLVLEGRWRNWVIQRCHFHLVARIQSRRSRFRIARHIKEAKNIFKQVYLVLRSLEEARVQESLVVLEEIGWTSTSPEIRKTLSGFVRNYQDYRSYLRHPELHLPTTNNTAESLASTIADLKHRMRGFPTFQSFEQWVIARLKFKQTIACNEFRQQH